MKNQKNTTPKKTTKKRKIGQLHYTVRRFSDWNNLTKAKKTKIFLFMNLIQAVKEGLDAELDQVLLVKLKGSNTSVLLNKAEWKPSLERALVFFTEHEMYETCQKCAELLEQI